MFLVDIAGGNDRQSFSTRMNWYSRALHPHPMTPRLMRSDGRERFPATYGATRTISGKAMAAPV